MLFVHICDDDGFEKESKAIFLYRVRGGEGREN